MPNTDIELKYYALTIDTSIFDAFECQLEKGYFRQLSQFKDGQAKLILSEIVVGELKKHILEKIKVAREAISKAIMLANKHFACSDEKGKNCKLQLCGNGDDENMVISRIKKFVDMSGADIIYSNNIKIERLLQMYFTSEAPFSDSSKKKNEFPDAIALLAIEDWANTHGKVLAVSRDADWKKFSDCSVLVDVVDNMADALRYFQVPNFSSHVIEELDNFFKSNEKNKISTAIELAISDSLNVANISVDATSSLFYDWDNVRATFESCSYEERSPGKYAELIRIDSKSIIIDIVSIVSCTIECDFTFYAWDSVDKEDIEIGSNTINELHEYSTDVLVTLEGDFSAGISQLDVKGVEVLHIPTDVYFGEISVDLSDSE